MITSVTKPKSRTRLLSAVQILGTMTFLVLIFMFVDFPELNSSLFSSGKKYISIIVLLQIAMVVMRGVLFWSIGRALGYSHLPLVGVIWNYSFAISASIFTPAGTGMFVFVNYLSRMNIPVKVGGAILVFYNLVTLLAFLPVAAVGLTLLHGQDPWHLLLIVLLMCGLAGGGIFIYFVWLPRVTKRSIAIESDIESTQIKKMRFTKVKRRYKGITVCLALSFTLLTSVQMYCGLRLFDIDIEFSPVYWLSGLARLTVMLPVSISGIGLYEGSFAVALGQIGADFSMAITGLLTVRGIIMTIAFANMCLWLLLRLYSMSIRDK